MNSEIGGASALRAPRLKVFQPVQIQNGLQMDRAHLLNLSSTGAMLHCQRAPGAGVLIRVDLGETGSWARVIWRDNKRFGVAFASKLNPGQIDGVLRAAIDLGRDVFPKASETSPTMADEYPPFSVGGGGRKDGDPRDLHAP